MALEGTRNLVRSQSDDPHYGITATYATTADSVPPKWWPNRQAKARSRAAGVKSGVVRTRSGVLHHPTTAEIDYSPDCLEWMMRVDAMKRRTGRQFPTLRELLHELIDLGWRKVPTGHVVVPA